MSFNDEQKSEIAKILTEALSSDDLSKVITKAARTATVGVVKSMLDEAGISGIGEKLTAIGERLDKAEKSKGDDKSKPGDIPDDVRKQLEERDQRIAALEDRDRKREEAQKKREAEIAAKTLRNDFKTIGAELEMRGAEQAFLYLSDKGMLRRADDDSLVIATKEDGVEETHPARDWLVKNFFTSEAGKIHAPAKAAGGSGGIAGDRGGRRTGSGDRPDRNALLDAVFSS